MERDRGLFARNIYMSIEGHNGLEGIFVQIIDITDVS